MINIEIEVVPDSYIGHKKKMIFVLVGFFMSLGVVYSIMIQQVIAILVAIMLSSIMLTAICHAEYVRRPFRLRITDDGITLFFKRLRPRFYPWSIIIRVFVLKQIPKMRGVMPTRGGFMLGERKGYCLDEQAALAIVRAYTEINGRPPRVISSVEGSTRWAIDPA